MYDTKSWSWVNDFYGELPVSSEEIIQYPFPNSKPYYFPAKSSFSSLNNSYTIISSDVLGQLGISTLLYSLGSSSYGGDAYGWNGDRCWVFENSATKDLVFLWCISWDDSDQAKNFYHSYNQLISRKYTDIQSVSSSENNNNLIHIYKSSSSDLYNQVICNNKNIIIAEGLPENIINLTVNDLSMLNKISTVKMKEITEILPEGEDKFLKKIRLTKFR